MTDDKSRLLIEDKLSKTQMQVLQCLRDHTGPLAPSDVAEITSLPASTCGKALSELFQRKHIKRIPAPGRGYKYSLVRKIHSEDFPEHKRIILTKQELYTLLVKWSRIPWEPKIFKSARNLPIGLARLYELAVEMLFGSSVTNTDLEQIKLSLLEFRTDLEQTLKVVNAVLAQKGIWTSKTLVQALLDDDVLPEEYREVAHRAKDKN